MPPPVKTDDPKSQNQNQDPNNPATTQTQDPQIQHGYEDPLIATINESLKGLYPDPSKPPEPKEPDLSQPAPQPGTQQPQQPAQGDKSGTPAQPDSSQQPAQQPAPEPGQGQDQDQQVKIRNLQQMVDRQVQEAMSRQQTQAPTQAPPLPSDQQQQTQQQPQQPQQQPDPDANLGDAEQHEIKLWEHAAEVNPAHKGMADNWRNYFRRLDEYIEKSRFENPNRTFDSDDEDFQEFIRRHQPKFDPQVRRKVEMDLIRKEAADEAYNRAKKDFESRIEKTEKWQREQEAQPKIQKSLENFQNDVVQLIKREKDSPVLPVLDQIEQVGVDKAMEQDKLFTPLVMDAYQRGVKRAQEYAELINQTKAPDESNPDHKWLADFIRNQGETFLRTGGDNIYRGNKRFVPRAEYYQTIQRDPAQADRLWTMNDDDVMKMIALNAKVEAEHAVKQMDENLKAAGFTRNQAAQAANQTQQQQQPQKNQPSPKTQTTQSPGPASGDPPQGSAMSEMELQALGIANMDF